MNSSKGRGDSSSSEASRGSGDSQSVGCEFSVGQKSSKWGGGYLWHGILHISMGILSGVESSMGWDSQWGGILNGVGFSVGWNPQWGGILSGVESSMGGILSGVESSMG